MPQAWTGRLVGRMHIHDITITELAKKFGFTSSYLGMVLHGQRRMENAESRINDAINQIIEERRAARAVSKQSRGNENDKDTNSRGNNTGASIKRDENFSQKSQERN